MPKLFAGRVPLPQPSWRVRAYIGTLVFRYVGFAFTFLASASRLSANSTFDVVKHVMPIEGFALLFIVLGVAGIGGMIWPADRPTRVLLGASATVSALFGFGLAFSGTSSPAAVAFITFAAIDLLVTGLDYRPRIR